MLNTGGEIVDKNSNQIKIFFSFFLLTICFLWTQRLFARDLPVNVPVGKVSTEIPMELENVGITEHLGRKVDLNLEFLNENGEKVTLGKYFDGRRPVFLSLVYYACPNLCSFHLTGVTNVLKKMTWSLGNEFDMVVVSIDPAETAELAGKKKAAYLESYGRPESAKGWHFLTGSEAAIKQLAEQVGFAYRWDEESGQWVHAAAAYVLSPTGTISRYLYGIEFSDKTLRLSLIEAADNKIGTIVDRVLLYCLRYDPAGRTYSFYLFGIMRVMAALTAAALIVVLAHFWWRQRCSSNQTF